MLCAEMPFESGPDVVIDAWFVTRTAAADPPPAPAPPTESVRDPLLVKDESTEKSPLPPPPPMLWASIPMESLP